MNLNFRNYAQLSLWCSLVLSLALQRVLAQPYRGRYVDLKCTDATTGRELLVGDAYTRAGQCVRVQCLGNLSIWEDRCQTPNLGGNCARIPADNESLNYPKCCPLFECKTYETNEHGETEETHTYDHYGRLKKSYITQLVITNPTEVGQLPGAGIRTQFHI